MSDDAGAAEDLRMGRIVLRGTLVGYVVIDTMVTALSAIGGAGMPASLWIGLFAAFWAGPGWGGMMAFTLLASAGDLKPRRASGRSRDRGAAC